MVSIGALSSYDDKILGLISLKYYPYTSSSRTYFQQYQIILKNAFENFNAGQGIYHFHLPIGFHFSVYLPHFDLSATVSGRFSRSLVEFKIKRLQLYGCGVPLLVIIFDP